MIIALKSLGEKIHDAMLEFAKNPIGHWSRNDLAGGCAVGSSFFMEESRRRLGLKLKFQCCDGHAWNEYQGVIYDITATQFGMKEKVFIVPVNDLASIGAYWHRGLYESKHKKTLEHTNHTWPKEQRPNVHRLHWINQNKAKVVYDPKGM